MTDRFRFDLIPPGSTVLCAVSGGADSMYLLSRLDDWRISHPFTLIAAHYNHNLRGEESRRDEEFVRQFVERRCGAKRVFFGTEPYERSFPPVELIVGSGDIAGEAKRRKLGIEETARAMRYEFLNETADQLGADFIATAHTADDNVETLLLHLARGSGLRGLTGIPPQRERLIRPMLEITRAEIEDHLRRYGVPHIEDSSNADERYARNRIRHQVIPVLEGLYPGLAARLAEELPRFRADEDHLVQQAAEIAAQASQRGEELIIPANAISGAPQALAVRAARLLLARMKGGDTDCAAAHLEAVVELCRGTDPSARADLPGGVTARREYELLVLTTAPMREPPPPLPLDMGETRWGDWSIVCRPALCPGKAYVSPSEFYLRPGGYLIRSRQTGDAVKLGPRPRRTVKRLMIDGKIPAVLRPQIPVLDGDGKAAAVGGFGPDTDFLAAPSSAALHIKIRKKEGE